MEVVRRDWTALAKQVQRELYKRLFAGRAVDSYLAEIVRQVRSGELDDALVYRKNLRKDADDYTASTPPHVAAARKSTQPQGRLISYVMTTPARSRSITASIRSTGALCDEAGPRRGRACARDARARFRARDRDSRQAELF